MQWFYNLKIGVKLLSSFILVAVIAIVIGLVGITNIRKIDKDNTKLYERMTVPISQMSEVSTRFQMLRVDLSNMIMESDAQKRQESAAQLDADVAQIDKISAEFEKLIISNDMKTAYAEFTKTRDEFAPCRKQIANLALSGKTSEATIALRDALPQAKAEQTAINKLDEMMIADAKATSVNNSKTAKIAETFMLILLIGAAGLAVGLGLFISRIIGSPVNQMAKLAEKLSVGDIDVTVESNTKDEIGDLARSMSAMVNNIRSQSEAADKIAQGDLSIEVKAASPKDVLAYSMIKVVETLRALVDETVMLSKAAVNGKLETRGDAAKFDGGYKEIIQGVNDTLDTVVNPINEAAEALNKLADNDLTARMVGTYMGDFAKIKESLNSAAESLEATVVQASEASSAVLATAEEVAQTAQEVGKASQSVAETINQVASGSTEQTRMVTSAAVSMEQLTQAIDEVSKGAQIQAHTVEETVGLIQQISNAIDAVAHTAQGAAKASLEVADVAKSGGTSVQQSVQGMARIRETSDNVAKAVVHLGENSKQIGAIVETIDDIAEQTNLLALNAAIEAARAGEHGKGFAVVADEVRKLAERSSMATKEIADLIGKIQTMTEHAVEAMQAGTAEVESGTDLANEAGQALGSILSAVNGIVSQIEDVSAATQQMSASSAEVAKAVETLSAITEESTASTEEMAASASEVSKSVELVAAVSQENAASAEEVSAAAQQQNASVEEMSASADEVARIATGLQEVVNQFKVGGSSSKTVSIKKAA